MAKNVLKWALIVVFGVSGIALLFSSPIAGIALLLAAAVVYPKTADFIQEKIHRSFSTSGKVVAVLVFMAIGGATLPQSGASPSTAPEVPVTQSVADAQSTVKKTPISYQIVDRWTIPNGGDGKVVVISPDLLNETDMVALGNKLKSDVQNDRNAFISVFDNASAAALRDKVLSQKATAAEQDLYDEHFVGEYDKNANTGYHEFDIYFDGVMGTNQKTIQY